MSTATAEVKEQVVASPLHNEVTPEGIEQLAHHLWQERGCPIGSPEDDWFEAERQLTALSSNIADEPVLGLVR
jgi:hypothetical protein